MRDSKRLDVATGYFDVGSLLDLDGDWQRLDKIRLLMGDEVTTKTKEAFSEALRAKDQNGIERAQEEDDWKALDGLSAITKAIGTGALEARVHTRAKSHAKARLSRKRTRSEGTEIIRTSSYRSASIDFELEADLEKAIIQLAGDLLGPDRIYLDSKKKISAKHGNASVPDRYLVDLSGHRPRLHAVEN